MKILLFLCKQLLFSNLYISIIVIFSCNATARLFNFAINSDLIGLVSASTLCSYSLHWSLTYSENSQSERLIWTQENRKLLFFLAAIASSFAAVFAWKLIEFWAILLPLAALTFIYTAPKIPFRPFTFLRGKAVAKTLYLTIVWTIVTAILPILVAKQPWTTAMTIYAFNRFCFIFAICALFDYRDKSDDALSGIKTGISRLSSSAFDRLFYTLMLLVFLSFGGLTYYFIPISKLSIFGCTAFVLLFSYQKSKDTNSDFWYYGVLDGLIVG